MLKQSVAIKEKYEKLIDMQLDDLLKGRADQMQEIGDFAEQLHLHPTHFSNTIKELTGSSPCGIYQLRILETAERLLADPDLSIRRIALMLTYEPSQFIKWFKRFRGITPKEYRAQILKS
jgi:AraC family transcriptional regulator, regulatory protein of adaptative response / methylphosphotriester-DNA alkyltransferase methyltransferase